MPNKLELTYLGTQDVQIDGRAVNGFRTIKAQALLCYLAVSRRMHSRPALSGLLWGDTPEKQARASLRQTLSNLTELCADCLTITRQTIAFDREHSYSLDTERFETAAARVVVAPGLVELHADLDLYRGDFLEGFYVRNAPDFETWLLGVRAHYRELALQAFNAVSVYWMEGGDTAQAISYSRRLLEIEPWHEDAHRHLMQLLAQTGQRMAALEQYRICRQLLADELGIEPDEATQALYTAIRSNSQSTASPLSTGTMSGARRHETPGVSPLSKLSLPAFLAADDSSVVPPQPFVGRRPELAALAEALAYARAGQGQIRFVVGGAGQGKSALVHEFIRQSQAADHDLLAIIGHCSDYTGTGDPYLPFREALALLAGEVESQASGGRTLVENARRLWTALPTTLPSLIEYGPGLIGRFVTEQSLLARAAAVASPHVPWFKHLAALTANMQKMALDERGILSQFTATLKAIAERQPLLLILEDLHWVDLASSGLLFHLSRTVRNSRILVVGTYRPDEVAARPRALPDVGLHPLATILGEFKRQHGAIWLDLDALTVLEGRLFVDEYVDTQPNQLDAAFRAALFQHTGGHALFTVELLHELQARGDLYLDGTSRWVTRGETDWRSLPAKVEGVIEKQLASLDGGTQAILRVACVQGESFDAEVIAQILHLDTQTLVQHLSQELGQKRRLVNGLGLAWMGHQCLSRYSFRHYLFQHYLYHSLDEVERRHLHGAIGTSLEGLYGEQAAQIATQLAYHFRRAGLVEKAVGALLQAGQWAQQLAAHQEAIRHLTQGLELLRMLPRTVACERQELDYLIALGTAMDTAGSIDQPEIETVFLRARTLCHQLRESRKLWPVLYGLYLTHLYRGQNHQALAYANEMLHASTEKSDLEPLLLACFMLGVVYLYLAQPTESITRLQRLLELYDPAQHNSMAFGYGNADIRVDGLAYLAAAKWMTGYPDQSRQHTKVALQIASEIGHPYVLAMTLMQAVWLHDMRREAHETSIQAAALIDLATKHEFHFLLSLGRTYEGSVLIEQGHAELGMARQSDGLAELEANGNTMSRSHRAAMRAKGYAALGQSQAGLDVIETALATEEQSGEHWYDAELYRYKGELLRIQGAPVERVEGCFEQAIVIARRQQARLWELRATVSLCRLWQALGKPAAAHALLAEIYGWFTEGFDTVDLLEAKALLETLQ